MSFSTSSLKCFLYLTALKVHFIGLHLFFREAFLLFATFTLTFRLKKTFVCYWNSVQQNSFCQMSDCVIVYLDSSAGFISQLRPKANGKLAPINYKPGLWNHRGQKPENQCLTYFLWTCELLVLLFFKCVCRCDHIIHLYIKYVKSWIVKKSQLIF